MPTFKINYYYLATGMKGKADTMPTKTITAVDRDHAIYEYMHEHFYPGYSFDRFMLMEKYKREWGLTVIEEKHAPELDETETLLLALIEGKERLLKNPDFKTDPILLAAFALCVAGIDILKAKISPTLI